MTSMNLTVGLFKPKRPCPRLWLTELARRSGLKLPGAELELADAQLASWANAALVGWFYKPPTKANHRQRKIPGALKTKFPRSCRTTCRGPQGANQQGTDRRTDRDRAGSRHRGPRKARKTQITLSSSRGARFAETGPILSRRRRSEQLSRFDNL